MNILNKDISETIEQYGTVLTGCKMSEFTSFRTGGTVDVIVYPDSHENAAGIIKLLHEEKISYIVLGGCTNLVVSDDGLRGVVVKMSNENQTCRLEVCDDGRIYADAGVTKSDFINFAVEKGYGKVEFMVGIPGCIGGGIIMNAGTFMGTFSDILDEVVYVDLQGNIKVQRLDPSKVSYRNMNLEEETSLILGGFFKLPKSDDTESLKKRIEEIITDRKIKHPWEYPSAGSVFKNPEGHASWKLVNDAGLKGYSIGGAFVSEKHTNFIINKNNASSAEIRALVTYIQKKVAEKYNIDLHTEIRMIGEFH